MRAAIRAERASDSGAVRKLLLAAFPTAAEADLVERLRQEGAAELALVAELGGEVVGHVMLSRMKVEADGRACRALGLAPVAVSPRLQRRGIGGALIEEALVAARLRGEEIVFVLGEPAYYRRFGFSAGAAEAFSSPYSGPYLMAQALTGLPPVGAGRADYAPAFAGLG